MDKTSLDILLNNLGEVLTLEYGIDITFKLTSMEKEKSMYLVVQLVIEGESIDVGEYADNRNSERTKFLVRLFQVADKITSQDKAALYEEGYKQILSILLFGKDALDLKHVIIKWEDKHG